MNDIMIQLRAERERQGLSIAALAQRLGVSPATLGSHERSGLGARNGRRPTVEAVQHHAAGLGLRLVLIDADGPTDITALSAALRRAATAEIERISALVEQQAAAEQLKRLTGARA
jgi:transcriptional regulator with XRE-family HTH domain